MLGLLVRVNLHINGMTSPKMHPLVVSDETSNSCGSVACVGSVIWPVNILLLNVLRVRNKIDYLN